MSWTFTAAGRKGSSRFKRRSPRTARWIRRGAPAPPCLSTALAVAYAPRDPTPRHASPLPEGGVRGEGSLVYWGVARSEYAAKRRSPRTARWIRRGAPAPPCLSTALAVAYAPRDPTPRHASPLPEGGVRGEGSLVYWGVARSEHAAKRRSPRTARWIRRSAPAPPCLSTAFHSSPRTYPLSPPTYRVSSLIQAPKGPLGSAASFTMQGTS